ncbi:LLM class flavin-dependent oxidoreductase [Methylopila sp. M107]|uniref:LLM class flavin-dependent oxidoreductase n=1 Tax=Methylopila sp. M107 TaxID=1101190 RepID=UPI0003805458|nr:LLM class flavin-dependent oxidoreductase [Methylopila sp. M107]
MGVEFIGYVAARDSSETRPATGPAVDVAHIEAAARAHEAGGFDRVLVAFHSTSPDSLQIAQHITSVTSRLGVMIAHRPGFTQPTVAARQFATLDQLSGGRVAIHVITGGDDVELAQDGSFLPKDDRYKRTDEYLDILRRVWTAEEPFDHTGRFYLFEKAFSAVKPVAKPHLPIYFGGASGPAIRVAAKHADVYALWGETLAQTREIVSRVSGEAARYSRAPRFSLSLRPILADTEEAAWRRAADILDRARAFQDATGFRRTKEPVNAGSTRLLEAAAQGPRLDKRLWTELSALTGAKGNSTSLVGTPEQVADAMLDYHDLGVSTFLIRGFDPIEDAVDYGARLIPLVRRLVAERRSSTHEAAA